MTLATLAIVVGSHVTNPANPYQKPQNQAPAHPVLNLEQVQNYPRRRSGGSRAAEVVSWEQLFRDNRPPRRRSGGSRGDEALCVITPVDNGTEIDLLHNRPILVWHGSLARVEVYTHNSSDVFWSQDLSRTSPKILPLGVTLEPGEKYDLVLYENAAIPIPTQQMTIQLLGDTNQRQKITQAARQLLAELEQTDANEERAAITLFEYLSENQLWSDALVEPFLVSDPSPELRDFLQKTLIRESCQLDQSARQN
ncbi:MAG: hypothetical protein ACFBSC_05375 [Microcoleaceae cyanobacterium]